MAELYIGLMSGTSLDGVDAALIDFGAPWRIVETHFTPYPEQLRTEALALNTSGANEIERAALFANALTELYAHTISELLLRAGIDRSAVTAIGCHGQTVRHRPELGFSVQISNPALLAERTQIRVVTDFRSRDIAAKGHGAPLVPAYHAACFRHPQRHRVIANIGGIANVTDLPTQGNVIGFDTGPGNLFMDAWCARHIGAPFDRDGRWAAKGSLVPDLLRSMLADPFFAQLPPKSSGRDYFNETWLARFAVAAHTPVDVQATLLELSAASIAQAIRQFCPGAQELYICGGGAANPYLMERLNARLPDLVVKTTEALGLHPDWVEAVAFAWLARQSIQGLPGNLPEVTGALGPRVLGGIYPP